MKTALIPLGFALGSGEPVSIPVAHTAVTGMTQQSGKTTTLEAMVARSGVRGVAFITKRGEGSFAGAHQIPPYFRERVDWRFVASLIDATLGEKNKLLRSFLMKVCRNAKTLAEVRENVKRAMTSSRGFTESIYTEIDGYLDLVVPQIERLPQNERLVISQGLNVMDLSTFSVEIQGLCVRSVMEHIYQHETGVVTIVPEAWELLPDQRGSPVKLAAEELIRKGAVLGNFMWLDSQDMAGVWKVALRACPVWIIGVQREANELRRTLLNMPVGTRRPKADDVATLGIGEFYVCYGNEIHKTYVRPAWLSEAEARSVAQGVRSATSYSAPVPVLRPAPALPKPKPTAQPREEKRMMPTTLESLERQLAELDQKREALAKQIAELRGAQAESTPQPAKAPPSTPPAAATNTLDVSEIPILSEALYVQVRARALQDPELLRVLVRQPELQVTVTREALNLDGRSLRGNLAQLIAKGFFKQARTPSDIRKELARHGQGGLEPNIGREMKWFAGLGYVTIEEEGFLQVPNMKINLVED